MRVSLLLKQQIEKEKFFFENCKNANDQTKIGRIHSNFEISNPKHQIRQLNLFEFDFHEHIQSISTSLQARFDPIWGQNLP